MKIPLTTTTIIVATTAVVIGQQMFPSWLILLGASWPDILHGEVWRLATGTLVHGLGFPQLVVNMAALVVFGPGVERVVGGWAFAFGYFIAGGLVWLAVLITTDPSFIGAGASAAVFAVMGASAGLSLASGARLWAAMSAAAIVLGLFLGVVLRQHFGITVVYAHLYGALIGGLGGLLLSRRGREVLR